MITITFLITEGFADWEPALLSATARGWYGCQIRWVSPGGAAVTSAGGMRVTPEGDLSGPATDALVVVGGTAWRAADAPDAGPAVRAAAAAGAVVAGICDGTRALAGAGLLDRVAHTSNDAATLEVPGYAGASRFRASAAAVRDGHIVTAAGTAPVSFMAEVMAALGLADDNLSYYLGLLAAEHGAARRAA